MTITKIHTELNLKLFSPFNATKEEWIDLHDYRKRYYNENVSDLPFFDDETYDKRIIASHENPTINLSSYEVIFENKMVGALGIRINNDRTKLDVNLKLLKQYRRQGIGSKVLVKVSKIAKEKNIFSLTSSSIENDGKEFLKAIGSKEESKNTISGREEIIYQIAIEILDQYLKNRNLLNSA